MKQPVFNYEYQGRVFTLRVKKGFEYNIPVLGGYTEYQVIRKIKHKLGYEKKAGRTTDNRKWPVGMECLAPGCTVKNNYIKDPTKGMITPFVKGFCYKHRTRMSKYNNLTGIRDRKTHGQTSSAGGKNKVSLTYKSWQAMKERCLNPQNKNYLRYGARGITIYEPWITSFETFSADMGERKAKDLTLDRIDNSRGYSPENCRWATKKEQAANRGKSSLNKSGTTGVFWDKYQNRWKANIARDGVAYKLGTFKSLGDAIVARKTAEKELQKSA